MDESSARVVRLVPTEAFLDIVSSTVVQPTETTLARLLDCFPEQSSPYLIDQVTAVSQLLETYGLESVPSVTDGELHADRLLRLRKIAAYSFDTILARAEENESGSLEFKSSFEYDHNKAAHAPDTPVKELQSASVRWAFLKTIAGFLNADGGILLVGIGDNGQCIGIQHDFPFLKTGHQDADGWQLHVRDVIGTSFHQGARIRDYIQIATAQHSDGRVVARIAVTPRRRLSFLLDQQKKCFLYRRQGNLTHEVLIQDIEEFLQRRWGLDS